MMFLQLAAEMNWGMGLAAAFAALGAGIVTIGAGYGISRIASASVESIARQPEASGDIRGAMILTAALIEGVALFAAVICFMTQSGIISKIT
jgi:F-type H+-transporting ATPase subunit c